jgi:Holliday junction resolvase RusA-like endonuclease
MGVSTSSEEVVIVLPLPKKVLSPNCPVATAGGRFAKAAATKKYKARTVQEIEQQFIDTLPWGRVEISSEFYHKIKRDRDTDNAMGMLKAVYDGIVVAGVVAKDTPEFMERRQPTFHIDKKFPRVVLTLRRLE